MRRTQAGGRDPGKAEFELRPGSLVVHFALSGLVPLAEVYVGGEAGLEPRPTCSCGERISYLGGTDDGCRGPDRALQGEGRGGGEEIIVLPDAYFLS